MNCTDKIPCRFKRYCFKLSLVTISSTYKTINYAKILQMLKTKSNRL